MRSRNRRHNVARYIRHPKDAKNVDAAHKFINYMMEPEVIAKSTNYASYANANTDAQPVR